MSDTASEREIFRIAERRARRKLGFYWHAAVFIVVNTGLAAINLSTTPGYFWFLWPLAGWGVGLALHAFASFVSESSLEELRRREIHREAARRTARAQ